MLDREIVYAVQTESRYIKFGFTTDIAARVYALCTKKRKVVLVGQLPCSIAMEAQIHNRFRLDAVASARPNSLKEWFHPTAGIIEFIETRMFRGDQELPPSYEYGQYNVYTLPIVNRASFATLLAREARLVAADHAASDRAHFAYRQHEKRTVYYPMRAAALKLANDITAAVCVPSKLIAFPSTVETGKAA